MNYALWFQLASPEIVLSASGLVLLLIAAWGGEKASRLVSVLTVAALFGALALSFNFLLGDGFSEGADAFYGQYRMDRFASLSKVLIFLSAIACVIVAPKFFARGNQMRPEYPILILFASIGMGLMVSAVDLLTLYIGLELNSLAAYVLASFLRSDDRSAEAGLKYFVLGALASGILLFGMSLLYGFTGTTSFIGIQTAFADGVSSGALFGIVFVLSGLAFKISAVPFHMWTPDVYEGAPTPVTTFFATAPKVAALALTMRVAIEAFGGQQSIWQQIVIFVALASIILGAAGAIGQTNIKRLLAYSSINNVGFALVGLAAGSTEGVAAVLVYLAIYVVMTLGSFLIVLQMRGPDGQPVEAMDSLSGLSRTQPRLALALAIMMFSLAGIPPLFGFYAKFAVFWAAVQAGLFAFAAIGIAASVIGAYYYLRVVKTMYFDEPAGAGFVPMQSRIEGGLILASAAFLSPLGYLAIPALGAWSLAAAQVLFPL